MATQTYVGARYVPKFMGEYDSTTVYEALSVVDNGLGTSYISKIPTPAGTPLTDTTHWALYGASSGAIFDLQTRMTEAEGDITDLEAADTALSGRIDSVESDVTGLSSAVSDIDDLTKRFANEIVIIGDSYGNDEAVGGGYSWAHAVEDTFSVVYNGCVGRTGFGTEVDAVNTNWLGILSSLNIPDKKKISTILVMGGANDGNDIHGGRQSVESLTNHIDAFMQYCATNFPNAIVKLSFIAWHNTSSAWTHYLNTAKTYRKACLKHANAVYYKIGERLRMNSGFTTDSLHPDAYASKLFGDFAITVINDGQYNYDYRIPCVASASSVVDTVAGAQIICEYNGENVIFELLGTQLSNSAINIKLTADALRPAGSYIKLFDLTNMPPIVHDFMATTTIYIISGTNTGVYNCILCIKDGEIGIILPTGLTFRQFYLFNCQCAITYPNNVISDY